MISIQCMEYGFVLANPRVSGIHLLFCTGKLYLADEVENKKRHLENAKVGSMWVLTKSSKPQECATASKSYATRPTHHHYGISALFSSFTDIVFVGFFFTFSPLNQKVYVTRALLIIIFIASLPCLSPNTCSSWISIIYVHHLLPCKISSFNILILIPVNEKFFATFFLFNTEALIIIWARCFW